MTHQAAFPYAPGLADAGARIAQLRAVLALAGELGGRRKPPGDSALGEAGASAAYAAAAPIDQRRFDELSAAAARWAETGLAALLALTESGRPARAAAGRLADELERALGKLEGMLEG